MLEIESVSWKNFMSYGDYVTHIDISSLGTCLMTGIVEDELGNEVYDTNRPFKSNGAGKSCIANVIQWILFGRTMHSHAPGDKIINWFTGKNCWGKIQLKNGDSITRTRNFDGRNEIIYVAGGDEHKLTADTLATGQHQQAQLAKTFNLDWEIFCGSAFFNQYGKPWMEMADQTRKKAFERLLHVDRFVYYSNTAKGKCDNLDNKIRQNNALIDQSQREIVRLTNEIERYKSASANFDSIKADKLNKAQIQLQQAMDDRDKVELPDIQKLTKKWDVYKSIQQQILQSKQALNDLNDNIRSKDYDISTINNKIKQWHDKLGKMCITCEQPIASTHVESKVEPLVNQLQTCKTDKDQIQIKRDNLNKLLQEANALLEARKPAMSIEEAKHIHQRWQQLNKEVNRLSQVSESITNESDPYQAQIEQTQRNIISYQEKITKLEEENNRHTILNKHYYYVHKAYHDRTKIKSLIFRDHLPFINNRLKYYLEVFDLDVKIEITDSLGISSNMWGYEFESGGERKRTDVALMLAIFDFHESIYGRQCNVLVLDEVDGRLDESGVDSLINIIKDDIAHKVESVLIISHKNSMFDTFQKEIRVKRSANRLSRIVT